MSTVIDHSYPTFAERVGGRWAIAHQKWTITALLMPLLAAGYTKNLGDSQSVLLWGCFSFIGLCLVGGIDFLLNHTLFKNRSFRPVPVWWVIANSSFGGFLIGSCAWVGGSLGEVRDTTQIAARIPGLALLGALWGIFLTLVLDYRERATRSRMKYIDQMVQLELVKVQQSVIVDEAIHSVKVATNRAIEKIHDELFALKGLSAQDLSSTLRLSASEAIKPLSKKLWESAKSSYPRFRIRDVILHSVRNQPFRPFELAMLTVVLSAVDRMARVGTNRGLLITALVALGVVVELGAANWVLNKYPSLHLKIFVTTVVLVELQTIAVVVWERHLMNFPVSYIEIVVSVAASLFLIFLTVGLRSFGVLSGQVAQFASEGVEAERITSIARDRAIGAALREMARDLHGNVQTRLVSCAMALDLAAEAGDGESANAALLEARRVLMPSTEAPATNEITLAGEVGRKVDVWSGLCTCSVAIDVHEVAPDVIERIGSIVEEGISNAVRHGAATALDVQIHQKTDGSVLVRVSDNGSGVSGDSMGLGSAIIEHSSNGQWTLTSGFNGAVLEATIR